MSIFEFERLLLLPLMIYLLLYWRETEARRGDGEYWRLSEEAERHNIGFIEHLSSLLD